MTTLLSSPPRKAPSTMMWITSVAIVLFCGVGIAAFMGWIPTSLGDTNAATETLSSSSAAAQPASAQVAANNSVCATCGVIESVKGIDEDAKSSGLGVIGGALVGGLLGHQVGGGTGKDLATVAGAVGGAVAGNAVEKSMGAVRSYAITVRFDDGSSRVFSEASAPTWHTGDRVKLVDGTLRADG